ncbi:long-chain acyl-CoA synthetase, partial [Phenoliferia sp. Uapishka_3]
MSTTSTTGNVFPVALPSTFDLNHQSRILPHPTGEPSTARTPIYVHSSFPPSIFDNPLFPKTGYQAFNHGLAANPNGRCLGRRAWDVTKGDWANEYSWDTYAETATVRDVLGSGIKHLAGGYLEVKAGIWCGNRPEWQQIQLALSSQSFAIVSLYDTLGPSAVHFCLQHAEISIAFVSAAHLASLIQLCGPQTPALKTVVCVDLWEGGPGGIGAKGLKELARTWGEEKGVKVFDLAEVAKFGREFPAAHNPPKPDTIASICYTSGTTGNPKGAILLHSALAAAAVSNLHGSVLDDTGVFISYLPLSHIYERFCEDVAFIAGSAIGYSCGDNLRLLEDLQVLQPTVHPIYSASLLVKYLPCQMQFFVSVPRVLNRVYQALKAATVDAPGFKGKLMRKAFGDKLWNLEHKGQITHAFWDKAVFGKVRALLGGKIDFIGSGSAPIAPEVLAFLKVAFSANVTEGYGQTENCGTGVRCPMEDHKPAGTVGPPQPGVEVMLIDVPDMGYFSTDKPHPRGELCTRGPNVIPAYYKDEAKSKETIDEYGWLHSGDVASVDEKGRFKIIDRIKNLVKLSQGEYVALEKVENIYSLCPLIAQIYVHADSLQDHVVGVIVPDPIKLSEMASKVLGKHCSPTDIASLRKHANDPKLIAAIAKELGTYAETARLQGYERLNKNIHVSLEPFTMENDLLTPTFKTKRNIAAKVYKEELAKFCRRSSPRPLSYLFPDDLTPHFQPFNFADMALPDPGPRIMWASHPEWSTALIAASLQQPIPRSRQHALFSPDKVLSKTDKKVKLADLRAVTEAVFRVDGLEGLEEKRVKQTASAGRRFTSLAKEYSSSVNDLNQEPPESRPILLAEIKVDAPWWDDLHTILRDHPSFPALANDGGDAAGGGAVPGPGPAAMAHAAGALLVQLADTDEEEDYAMQGVEYTPIAAPLDGCPAPHPNLQLNPNQIQQPNPHPYPRAASPGADQCYKCGAALDPSSAEEHMRRCFDGTGVGRELSGVFVPECFAWGIHKFLCKGSDLDAFRQIPLERLNGTSIFDPESAFPGLEPPHAKGVLRDVLRDYVWSTFQKAFATGTPQRTNLITALVRHNNYENASYPATPDQEKNKFHALKAFCKVATLFCKHDPDGTLYDYPDTSTNEALRQLALCYWLLHHYQRQGHIMSAEEERLLETAAGRLARIAGEMRERGEEAAPRVAIIVHMWQEFVLTNVRSKLSVQRATGMAGPGEGQSWDGLTGCRIS